MFDKHTFLNYLLRCDLFLGIQNMKSVQTFSRLLVISLTLFGCPTLYGVTENTQTENIKTDNVATQDTLTPAAALDRLMLGNQRFVENHMACPVDNPNRRIETAEKQTPFAVVLGCSDSRVSPELTFAQGVGDIFVVRLAGNSVSPIALDSIEYSVEHNHSVIIIVLGHENCGAVQAVYNDDIKDIPDIAKLIKPVVDKVKKMKNPTLQDAIVANIQNSVAQVKGSPVIQKHIQANKVLVRGAYYHLETGQVKLLPE